MRCRRVVLSAPVVISAMVVALAACGGPGVGSATAVYKAMASAAFNPDVLSQTDIEAESDSPAECFAPGNVAYDPEKGDVMLLGWDCEYWTLDSNDMFYRGKPTDWDNADFAVKTGGTIVN